MGDHQQHHQRYPWIITVLVLLVSCVLLVEGGTVKWLPGNGGDLHTKSNWDTGTVPGSDDDVIIHIERTGKGAVIPVSQRSTFKVKSLTISGADATLAVTNTFTFTTSMTIKEKARVSVAGGTIEARPAIDTDSATLTISGTLSLALASVVSVGITITRDLRYYYILLLHIVLTTTM